MSLMRRRTHDRRLEWWFASQTLAFGLFLTHPAASMDSTAFIQLLLWMPENWWGGAFTLTGGLHITALWINGRRWWTPYIRSTTTIANLVAYFFFLVGFWLLDRHTTAVATYGALCVAACICLYGAAKDAVHARDGIQKGGRSAECH